MFVPSTHSNFINHQFCRKVLAALAILGLAVASVAKAQMPTIMLSSVFPPSGQVGTDVEVKIAGENLDEISGLQFSHPGIVADQKMNPPDEFSKKPTPSGNQFLVKIGKDVPPGTYEVRTVGRFGISNPRAFVVSDLKQATRDGVPDSREKAMPVEMGTAVIGQMTNQKKEYYSIEMKKGERVLIDCWCERIDSRMDPVVTLFDPNGRMLRRARQADPRDTLIQWEIQTAGPHIVMVHDFTYRGGAEYAYRLSFRKAPYIDFIYPPVGKPGSNEEYTIYGRNLPGGEPAEGLKVRGVPLEKATVKIQLPNDPKSLNRLPMTGTVASCQAATSGFSYRVKGPDGLSNSVLVHFADAPIIREQEPANNEQATPQKVSVPCEYVGQFYPERDRDWIAFEAKKGEVYWINVLSQRLGTSADPIMMIERVTKDAKGNEQIRMITKLDDAPYTNPGTNQVDIVSLKTDDPKYRLVADADATYRIRLNDLYNNPANDPRLVYRMVIQKESPDFQLVAYVEPEKDARNQMKPTACVLRRGGTMGVKLNLARQYGFEGEVAVRVEGLPKGVTCQGAEFGGKVTDGWLVFQADENAPAWAGSIRIIGTSEVDGKMVEREARYGTLLWPLVQNTPVASRLARDMTLSIVTAETFPVVLEAGEGKVIDTSLGAKLKIPLKVTAREKTKGDLKVSAVALHKDITRKDVTVKDKAETELYFRTTNIPTGSYTFYFQGLSKFSYKRNQDAVEKAKNEKKRADELKKKYDAELKTAQTKAQQATKDSQTAASALKTAQQTAAAAVKASTDLGKQVATAEQKLATDKKALEQNKDDKGKAQAVQQAEKALTDLKTKATEAENKKAEAEKALKVAEQKNQTAQKAKTDADAASKKATDMQKKADAYVKKADAALKSVTAKNKTADINLYVTSTPVKLRVHSHPLKINAPSTAAGKLQPEKTLEVPVSIERLYGFADKVDIEFTPPSGVKGISVARVSIDKNKKDAKLTFKAGKDLTPGSHTGTLKFRLRFNNVTLEAQQPITIQAEVPKELATK